jgi:hypothetical protein
VLESLAEENKIQTASRKSWIFFLYESRHILMLDEDLQIFILKFPGAHHGRRSIWTQR